ncbi:hypothetical protein [Bhargavaea beijingensis]|nr:hypothetical protein [Bhargavaea beijingensis]
MRDHLKDKDYFKDYIEQYHSAIVEFEGLAEQLINERGRNLGKIGVVKWLEIL